MNLTIPRSPKLKRTVACLTATATIIGSTLSGFVPSAAAATCGALNVSGSSWAGGYGVDSRSNGVYEGTGTSCGSFVTNLNANPPQYGSGWQCVELAQRMFNTRGWYSGTFSGVNYASQIYTTASTNGWTKMANGTITLSNIIPGDMLVTNEGTFGHVMMVDSISGNTINVVDQNAGDGGRDTVSFSNGSLSDGSYSFSGVVHDPDDTLGIGSAGGSFTPGITRTNNTNLQWHLRNENSGGAADVTPFGYGVTATDKPLPGDWDGNGTMTPGIVRNVSNQWQFNLRNSNTGGAADVPVFTYGNAATDTPIVGDWDGNGTMTPGVVRNVGGQWHWYLRNSNTGGTSNIDFGYGVAATDTPIVGDWDGNGTMTPGVVRIVGGQWQFNLRNSNTGGAADVPVFTYGNASTDTVIVGDWDGSGTMTPGIVRDNGGQWQWNLRNSNTGGAANLIFGYGVTATDTAIVGDWDGQ